MEAAGDGVHLSNLKEELYNLPVLCNLTVTDMFPKSWLEAFFFLDPFHLADFAVTPVYCMPGHTFDHLLLKILGAGCFVPS